MPDARVVRSRETVLAAARDLLIEGGPGAVTVDAVVARSGVAKSTIYRHWPSRDDLLLSVLEAHAPNMAPAPPDLGFEAALRLMARQAGTMFADPEWARMLPALIMLKRHEDGLAHLDRELHETQMRVAVDVFDRGVAEGILPPDYEADDMVAQIVGPMIFALIQGSITIDDAYCERIVDRFLDGVRRR